MFVLAGAVFGGLGGGMIAARRKGKWADIAQYAFVYALIFAMLGLFVTIFVHRAAL